jgi:hypothetical protein
VRGTNDQGHHLLFCAARILVARPRHLRIGQNSKALREDVLALKIPCGHEAPPGEVLISSETFAVVRDDVYRAAWTDTERPGRARFVSKGRLASRLMPHRRVFAPTVRHK